MIIDVCFVKCQWPVGVAAMQTAMVSAVLDLLGINDMTVFLLTHCGQVMPYGDTDQGLTLTQVMANALELHLSCTNPW